MSVFRALGPGLIAVMALAQCQTTTTPSGTSTPDTAVAMQQGASGGQLLNAFRGQSGLTPLRESAALNRAAAAHARDMGTNSFMSHTGSNGSKPRDRARAQGYRACNIAENIGLGQGSANEIMTQWMNSPPHRKNMLHRQMKEYGLARGPANAWVLVVADPGCR